MLTQFLNLLATIISVISLLIVTYGALIAIISFIINELKRVTGAYTPTNIRKLRAVFGTYLLLGLEFLIASDILENGIGTYNERTDYSGRYCRCKNHIIGIPQQRNQRIGNRK